MSLPSLNFTNGTTLIRLKIKLILTTVYMVAPDLDFATLSYSFYFPFGWSILCTCYTLNLEHSLPRFCTAITLYFSPNPNGTTPVRSTLSIPHPIPPSILLHHITLFYFPYSCEEIPQISIHFPVFSSAVFFLEYNFMVTDILLFTPLLIGET